jgi:hypothetical protein
LIALHHALLFAAAARVLDCTGSGLVQGLFLPIPIPMPMPMPRQLAPAACLSFICRAPCDWQDYRIWLIAQNKSLAAHADIYLPHHRKTMRSSAFATK